MEIKTFEVKSDILKKHINNYYVLTHSKNQEKYNYLVFPNTINVLSIYKHVEVKHTKNRVVLEGSDHLKILLGFRQIVLKKVNEQMC